MGSTKHTPGPWAAQLSDSDTCCYEIVQAFEGGDVVAGEYGIDSTDDARLIAAAPDLLAALRDIESSTAYAGCEMCNEVHNVARAAIAKAVGHD